MGFLGASYGHPKGLLSQTLRTQWFGNTFVILLDDSSIFSADRRSDTTNTMLSEEASPKSINVGFARQNK